jgi:hypothetical protein
VNLSAPDKSGSLQKAALSMYRRVIQENRLIKIRNGDKKSLFLELHFATLHLRLRRMISKSTHYLMSSELMNLKSIIL